MDINLSVWGYYPKDDSKFLDPMYVPYQSTLAPVSDGRMCPYPAWPMPPVCPGYTNTSLIGRNTGLMFQLFDPKDPCPLAWRKTNDGYCVPVKLEDGNFYKENQFAYKGQYPNGYAIGPEEISPEMQNQRFKFIDNFSPKSLNPFTGNYVNYYEPRPTKASTDYGWLPAKDGYV